ncbi:MAG TPA: PrsW family glutamic-type intramembrane protease [Anaerolineales bacterium]|nr:PrsW family glutamic-type intramembrane protease [Anaerolineales bacterium]
MRTSQTHLPSLLSGILFSLSGLFLFGIGLFPGVTALLSLFTGKSIEVQQTIIFIAFGFEAALLFAAAFFSFQKTLQKPSADQETIVSVTRWQIVILVLIAGASILIGNQVSGIGTVNWLVLPILTLPAVVLPLVVILMLGTQQLPLGTRWQSWSVLGLGMTLTPFVLLILEAVVAIILFFVIIAYVATQPELVFELRGLSRQIMILGPDSEAAFDLLAPLLTRPGVILTALTYMAILVPAIEELFKPLGVWLLAGRLDSTAQGFTLGALSGAGYALIETIGVSTQAGEWASLLFSRIGTGLLHITTSAMMGAAIVLAWRERHYMRLIGTYFLAFLLHGLWNMFAILFTFSSLAELLGQPGRLSTIQPTLIVIMSLLAVGLFAILLVSNRKMRRMVSLPFIEESTPANTVDQSP